MHEAHLTIQPCIPELWIHAKCCAMQVTVQVVPALADEPIHRVLLALFQAGRIHIVFEQAAVIVDLQQK